MFSHEYSEHVIVTFAGEGRWKQEHRWKSDFGWLSNFLVILYYLVFPRTVSFTVLFILKANQQTSELALYHVQYREYVNK